MPPPPPHPTQSAYQIHAEDASQSRHEGKSKAHTTHHQVQGNNLISAGDEEQGHRQGVLDALADGLIVVMWWQMQGGLTTTGAASTLSLTTL